MIGRAGRQGGMTFIELMVTLAVMAILAMISVPAIDLMHQRQQEQELRRALASIREALDAHKLAAEQGRIALASGASGYPASLAQLAAGVELQGDAQRRRLFFLRRIPRDPMSDAPASLAADLTWGLRSYEAPPDAPMPGVDVFDIHSTSGRTGSNGVPYRQW